MVSGRNQYILDFFKKAIETKKLAHGYLFWGSDSEGAKETALWLAEYLETGSFDILYIVPDEGKKEISIDQIRKARRHLSLSPYNGLYKFAIIDKAETMNSDAANALLKTLEEPKKDTVLILITSKPDLLPKTIISRLEEIRFKPVSLEKIAKDFLLDKEKRYIDILQKPLNEIFKDIEEISKEEKEVFPMLDSWLFLFRDLLVKDKKSTYYNREKLIKTIKEIQKTKDLISSTNVNQRLALENLALCIKNY
jgi:DNA polymerase III gamma/tau subunit